MNYKDELDGLFNRVENVYQNVTRAIEEIYDANNFSFENSQKILRTTEGDLYAKVLAEYLKDRCDIKLIQYEYTIPKTKKRIDILIDGKFAIEVKKSGVYDKPEILFSKWQKRKQLAPEFKHLFVSWSEWAKNITRFQENLGNEFFIFKKTSPKPEEYYPDDLKRLVEYINDNSEF